MKKPRSISQNLRRQIWDTYMGPANKKGFCGLCGINQISNYDSNGGFEACHVVAEKYMRGDDLNVYYLYPGCASCNNQCGVLCILDYLWGRERFQELRKFISAVYKQFIAEHDFELSDEGKLAHNIIMHLYGNERFPAGGGMVNMKQILEVARLVQYENLIQEGELVTKALQQNAKMLNLLMGSKIKMMKLLI
jgi:hypothetical protein